MYKLNFKAAKFSALMFIALVCFWVYNFNPSIIEKKDLIKISGTLKTVPHYESGTKGSAGAEFELNEYKNTTFRIPSGLYEHLDNTIFVASRVNDSITFYIEKRIFEKRLKNSESYSFFRDFLDGNHIEFYDLVYKGKNYLQLESFNKKVEAFNPIKHILISIFFIAVCFKLYKDLRK